MFSAVPLAVRAFSCVMKSFNELHLSVFDHEKISEEVEPSRKCFGCNQDSVHFGCIDCRIRSHKYNRTAVVYQRRGSFEVRDSSPECYMYQDMYYGRTSWNGKQYCATLKSKEEADLVLTCLTYRLNNPFDMSPFHAECLQILDTTFSLKVKRWCAKIMMPAVQSFCTILSVTTPEEGQIECSNGLFSFKVLTTCTMRTQNKLVINLERMNKHSDRFDIDCPLKLTVTGDVNFRAIVNQHKIAEFHKKNVCNTCAGKTCLNCLSSDPYLPLLEVISHGPSINVGLLKFALPDDSLNDLILNLGYGSGGFFSCCKMNFVFKKNFFSWEIPKLWKNMGNPFISSERSERQQFRHKEEAVRNTLCQIYAKSFGIEYVSGEKGRREEKHYIRCVKEIFPRILNGEANEWSGKVSEIIDTHYHGPTDLTNLVVNSYGTMNQLNGALENLPIKGSIEFPYEEDFDFVSLEKQLESDLVSERNAENHSFQPYMWVVSANDQHLMENHGLKSLVKRDDKSERDKVRLKRLQYFINETVDLSPAEDSE